MAVMRCCWCETAATAAATAAEGARLPPLLMQAAPPAAALGVLGPSPNSTSTCGHTRAGQVAVL